MVEQVVKALTGNGTVMPKNWNRRFKHNRDKMKTGDIFELAEVVRNLSLRDHEKGLSTGEKQMFVKAKKILSSELMYAKDMDEEEAALWLEDVLSGVGAEDGRRREGARVAKGRPQARVQRSPARNDASAAPSSSRPAAAERLGSEHPKAFARLGGRPLLAESLERLDASEWIEEIVVVAPAGWEEPAILLAEELGCSKVSSCVAGGETRAESARAGVREVPGGRGRDPRSRRRTPAAARRGRRTARDGAGGRLGRRRSRAAARRHRQARARRGGRRDARPRRARRGADAAGLRRRTSCAPPSAGTSPARATAPRWWRQPAAASRPFRAIRGC